MSNLPDRTEVGTPARLRSLHRWAWDQAGGAGKSDALQIGWRERESG